MSRRQLVVASPTAEPKYMVATHASKDAVCLQRLHLEIGFKRQVLRLDCDNQGAIYQPIDMCSYILEEQSVG